MNLLFSGEIKYVLKQAPMNKRSNLNLRSKMYA